MVPAVFQQTVRTYVRSKAQIIRRVSTGCGTAGGHDPIHPREQKREGKCGTIGGGMDEMIPSRPRTRREDGEGWHRLNDQLVD